MNDRIETNASITSLTSTDAQISSLAAQVFELQRKVSALHSLVQDTIDNLNPIKPRSVWYYDARFPLDVENLHPTEYRDTHAKRWVGPKPYLLVVVPMDSAHSYLVEIKVYDFITPQAKSSFILRVDGLEVPWESVQNKIYKSLIIPPRSGPMSLQFACGESKSPHDVNPASRDTRAISFSIGYIRIEPVESKLSDHQSDVINP